MPFNIKADLFYILMIIRVAQQKLEEESYRDLEWERST